MIVQYLTILFSTLILLICWWYINYLKLSSYLKKYSGPPVLPLIGHAHYFTSTVDIIPNFMMWIRQYGTTFKLMLGHEARLVISDSKVAEFLLSSPTILKKSYEYKFFYPWLGDGLITSSGENWKKHRKLITPAFHFKILEQFTEILGVQSETLIKKLRHHVNSGAFDIFPYTTLYTLDVICEAAMGTSVNAQNDSKSDYVHNVKAMCEIATYRSMSPIEMFDFLFKFTNNYQKQKRALKILHEYTNSVIVKRREVLLRREELTKVEEDDVGSKRKLAFLDLLLQSTIDGLPLSNESIREEVDTFMFAGHDTTTSGISFTLLCLSRNADVQEKAMEEQRAIFGHDKSRPPTYKDLQEMKYLEMVIKESLRLYPVAVTYSRVLEEDVKFDGDILPKGLTIAIFTYGLHRNAEVFPDPEKFDPERFSLENSKGRSPYAYVPFSAGPRNCIGQRFAMLELKATLSTILRNFKLLPAPNYEPILSSDIVLQSTNGVKLCLSERSN